MIQLRNRHFFLTDIVLIVLASYLSFALRLEGFDLDKGAYLRTFIIFAATSAVVAPLVFRLIGIYSRFWRYPSVEELILLGSGITVASALTGVLSPIGTGLVGAFSVPRSVPYIFPLLALALIATPRLAVRVLAGYESHHHESRQNAKRVLIMGAGDAGAMIVRELQRNRQLGMEAVGFLDDDPRKHNMRIQGLQVIGDRTRIPSIVRAKHVQLVIIAMPTAPGKAIRSIVQICEQAGVDTQIVPGIYEILGKRISVSQLRNVQIEDLLRREPARTNTAAVRELVCGRRVLVTGGGGSIGSELCRQLMKYEPAELITLGHGKTQSSRFIVNSSALATLISRQSSQIYASPTASARCLDSIDHRSCSMPQHISMCPSWK